MAPKRPPPTSDDDAQIDLHSTSALATTKRNLRYLYNPSTAPATISSRRTRILLRAAHSLCTFVFWRLVRYAKYVAIGSLVATLGAGVFGSLVSGVGFVLAPTGIMGTVCAASVYGAGRFVLRRFGGRLNKRDVEDGERETRMWRGMEMEHGEMPW